MRAYYNEFDPYCAHWLRNLINAGHIPPGDVDERSITKVKADEIQNYDQWHFFAGLGGWGHAARLAGIGEASGILTGSPPCQPFSSAGKRQGYADERHLAPVWLDLVAALRPAWVFGEQVAAAIKKDDWLDDLLDALEEEGYATGAAVLPACGVGAPHIRQRLWVVARLGDSEQPGLERHRRDGDQGQGWQESAGSVAEAGESSGMADAECWAAKRHGLKLGETPRGVQEEAREQRFRDDIGNGRSAGGLGDAERGRPESRNQSKGRPETAWQGQCVGGLADACDAERDRRGEAGAGCSGLQHAADHREASQRPRQAETRWDDPDWLFCRDGKWRPAESGTFPMADGIPARVGRLRAYGNAIVPQVAAEIIKAAMEKRNAE